MLRSIRKQSGESVESVLKKKRKATVGTICCLFPTFPVTRHRSLLTAINLQCLVRETRVWTTCPRLLLESGTAGSRTRDLWVVNLQHLWASTSTACISTPSTVRHDICRHIKHWRVTGRRLLWSTRLLLPTLLSDSQVLRSLMNRFRAGNGPCHANLHKWSLAQSPSCERGQRKTMNHACRRHKHIIV